MSNASDAINLITAPVTDLHGVGKQLAEKLAKLDIHCLQDILFHLPMRYQDRTRVVPIGSLRHGNHALIEGIIIKSEVKLGRRRQWILTLQDASGCIEVRFFYFSQKQKQQLEKGARMRCFGEARLWQSSCVMVHPEYEAVKEGDPLDTAQHLTPIYPSTDGIAQKKWQQLTEQVLAYVRQDGLIIDYMPAAILDELKFSGLREALLLIHRPPPDVDQQLLLDGKHPAQQRLVFEELLAHRLSMRTLRQQLCEYQAPVLPASSELRDKFMANLVFQLTNAQQKVVAEISQDLQQANPMSRLVQGDVGSGKTVVAAIAAIQAISQGYQVAIMAPTELLAEQHYRNFSQWFEPLGIRIGWLSGNLTAKQRRSELENVVMGLDQVIIGTHALFQKDVIFQQLALIIIDEQHRFGVHQRLALHEKGRQAGIHPHQLILTATPIPRTLAMTAYADLDTSVIDELPPGRTPVTTSVISNARRDEVIQRVHDICQQGGQAYWVCPLIEESEVLQCQTAEETLAILQNQLPDLRIGLIHGRLSTTEKEATMQAFAADQRQLLVATTVIEVGVDVPNASLMIIENAERFGLSQLHQLRGRVGRGSKSSHCLLLYQSPLSAVAKDRLATMRATTDGFKIAEKDLQIRGAGDVLGTRQTGAQQFRIADVLRDKPCLLKTNDYLIQFPQKYPEQTKGLIQRWVGSRQRFVQV